MKYRLSFLLPVPMRSRYGIEIGGQYKQQEAKWWQYRGHVWGHWQRDAA